MFIASPDCESRAVEAEMNFILVERVAKQKALVLIERLKVRCAGGWKDPGSGFTSLPGENTSL